MTTSTIRRTRTLAGLTGTIVLVGAGKMGGAMLEGWLALGLDPKSVVAIEPQPAREVVGAREPRPAAQSAGRTPSAKPPRIVIAVKPQVAPEVVPTLAPYLGAGTVVLSIMAGRTLGFLEQALSQRAALVRAMPNTPAAIGRGITVAVPNQRVSQRQRELVARAAVGDRRGRMGRRRGADGRGDRGVRLRTGLCVSAGGGAGPRRRRRRPAAGACRKLARETVAGSGELLHRSPLDASALRQNVTSPGGTTAAALDVLMAPDGLDPLMTRAVAAATRRSRELAG